MSGVNMLSRASSKGQLFTARGWRTTQYIKLQSFQTSCVALRKDSQSDYLQKSVIPTMHFQPSLPRLPVPKLEDSCRRYLESQKPLLTTEQFENTSKITEDFLSHEGRALQAEMVEKDKANSHTSYISGNWFDMYLKYRKTLVFNHNPYILLADDPSTNDQVTRASKILYSAIKFRNSLNSNILEPDVYHLNPKKSDTALFRNVTRFLPSSLSWYGAYLFKAFPLDMSQYKNLFNSTRIPRRIKDEIRSHPDDRHVVVARNGNYFIFDLIKEDGSILKENEIQANLKSIMEMSNTQGKHPVGYFTTSDRDNWADIRQSLESDPVNAESLRQIDGAILFLALDDGIVNDEIQATDMFLSGDGANRWFDKSISLIISKNSKTSVTMEHAWGDGVSVVRFLNDCLVDSLKSSFSSDNSEQIESNVRHLSFNFTEDINNALEKVKETYKAQRKSLGVAKGETAQVSRDSLKSYKLSPDSMMQLAFQMAFYRCFGKVVPTYESSSTSAFKHGRTETIRPATCATVACSEAFQHSHPATISEMTEMLHNCSKVHSQLTKEAAMGQGFDRHLFSLRLLAEQQNKSLDMFTDEAYQNINRIILSTSTVFNDLVEAGGFGPVDPKGLGMCYGVRERLGVMVTSYPESPNGKDLAEQVIKCLHDIDSVLRGHNFKQAK